MENTKAKMVLILYSMGCYGFVVTNYLSFGGDRGSWVYDRIIIVRCDNVIPEEKQDKYLVEHLLEEKEYIVSLAIRGLKQVINNGYKYNIPASCKLLNEDYKVENHSFLAFMKECVVDRPANERIKDKCTTAKFYKVYEEWCKDNNNSYKESKIEVNKILKELGKEKIKKTNGGNTYYEKITLSKEAKKEYIRVYDTNEADEIDTTNDENKDVFEDDIENTFISNYPTNDDMNSWAMNGFDSFDSNNPFFSDEKRAEIDRIMENYNDSNDVVGNNNENV